MSGCCPFDCVSTSEVGVIERFGKFSRLGEAGCLFLGCPCEYIVGRVSLRVQELNVVLDTKTKDNVFVSVSISVQYQVIREKVYSAFYALSDVHQQMRSYIFDTVRASICHLTLDETFEAKDEISLAVKTHLLEVMTTYGYTILNALVTDLSPDSRVRNAMNEINASKRLKEAAYQRAEAEKVVRVKKAEAEAESMYLSGVGVSRERNAIMDGLRESIVEFSSHISGTSPKDVMELLILNQYFDTLQEVGKRPNTRTVLLSGDNNATRDGLMQAQAGQAGHGGHGGHGGQAPVLAQGRVV